MIRTTLRLAFGCALFFAVGCLSPQSRQVSLENRELPDSAKSGESPEHVVRVSRKSSSKDDANVQPIPSAVPETPPRSRWGSLLSPFQAKKERIPLPLSKPIDGAELDAGIHAF